MIKDLQGKVSDFFGETSETVDYSLLDSYDIDTTQDKRLAVLRKVQFRNTKDGKPYIRAVFEDCNGYCIIGRMFDFDDINTVGKVYTSLVGNLVYLNYTPDYYNGSLCLQINSIEAVTSDVAAKYASSFIGKYNLADIRLDDCCRMIGTLQLSRELTDFCMTYCNLGGLVSLSDESVCKGLRGYILEIIYRVLLMKDEVSKESVIAFVYSVITWFNTRKEADVYSDDNIMLFIASMMDKRVTAASAGLAILSNKISEFAALFSGNAKVISSDSFLLYNLYHTYVEASNIKVLENRLPPNGFCSYKTYVIRRI